MRSESYTDIIFHDAVVQHAWFRGRVQANGNISNPGTRHLRHPEHSMEQLCVLRSPRFDDPPRPNVEPGADDRTPCEWNGVRPPNVSVDGFRTDGHLETARRQSRSNESAADVLRADDAVAHDRHDGLRLEPQVGPRIRLDPDLLPPPKRPGQRSARLLDFLQVHSECLLVAPVPFLVVEAVGLCALRCDAPNRQVDVPDPPLPPRFVLSVAPQAIRLKLLGWDVSHSAGVRGAAEVNVRGFRLGDGMFDWGGGTKPLRRQLFHRREPEVVRHERKVRVAPCPARFEGQRFSEWDGRRIGVDRKDVLPSEAEGRVDDLASERNPRFERRRGRLRRLKGHGLPNRSGRFKGLIKSYRSRYPVVIDRRGADGFSDYLSAKTLAMNSPVDVL